MLFIQQPISWIWTSTNNNKRKGLRNNGFTICCVLLTKVKDSHPNNKQRGEYVGDCNESDSPSETRPTKWTISKQKIWIEAATSQVEVYSDNKSL